jgi:leader peptidase (prepilin peptidase)/N-methyltransferase
MEDIAVIVWVTFAFMVGATVGSFLNVVVARLPLEKSLIWPGSRCGTCYKPIKVFFDNLPIISYLLLRGRCRHCGTQFSSRYLWVELGTGLCFAALFYLDIFQNWQQMPHLTQAHREITNGTPPLKAWIYFIVHATLLSFCIATSLCDLDRKTIPISITVVGTLVGLAFSTILPWPWPNEMHSQILSKDPWYYEENIGHIPRGVCPWPFWGPLPNWAAPGSPQLGLVTALAGAAMGTFLVRSVKWVFETGFEHEALGLGDADFMMMVGAFAGWQVVVAGFFAGAMVSLVGIVLQRSLGIVVRSAPAGENDRGIPFGPGLAIGSFGVLLAWPWLGADLQKYFFDPIIMFAAATIIFGGMFVASLLLRQRGVEEQKAA